MEPADGAALHVVLLHPEIPWNTGNVGRSCLAAGAHLHLVRPLGFSLDERRLRRAGLDYWPRLAPRVWPAWDNLAAALPTLGEPFFFTPEARRSFWEVDFPPRTVLLFGAEGTGIPAGLKRRHRERLVAVPTAAAVRSLNLSTAVAVVLYELLRQRREGSGGASVGAGPAASR